MSTAITLALVAFIAWQERDRIFAAIERRTPKIPIGPSTPEAFYEVSRHDAVDAVETLLAYARERDGMQQLERFAISAGRSLWEDSAQGDRAERVTEPMEVP